jgi:tetratricopeptide (TPR) repeat protein
LLAIALALAAGGAIGRELWLRHARRNLGRLDLLHGALADFYAGRYQQASALLDRRASLVGPTSLDWMLRARIAEAQGRADEALTQLKHIPDTDPIATQAWLKAGQIELARHHARAAEAAYRRALALNPDQIQSHRELAYLYAVQRRKAECDAEFRALARLMPFDYVLAFAWGQNDCEVWDPNESLKVLEPIVAAGPDDRWSRLAMAINYRALGLFDEAKEVLRVLGEADPDALALRIQIAMDRGEFLAAAKLARDGPPDHAGLNVLRGRLALHLGDARQAAIDLRAALSQDPSNRDAVQGLGLALRKLGEPEAEEFLRRASRRDELKRTIVACGNSRKIDIAVFSRLGELCESLGRPDQAGVWYRVAIGWDPLDSRAQQALARLNGP